jgi:integrase
MPKAKERDGVYYRKDRAGWWVSYMDASGERVRQKVEAHTRQQALDALRRIRTKEEIAQTLGVRPASEITTEALFDRYKRHQKARIRPTTYERLGGILDTLKANLPAQAKAITRRMVAEYIEKRAETVKPGTVAKEMSVLKHCLKLAVEWGELNHNPAAGARLPQLPPGKTRYLTPGELKAALESAPEWMRAPMAFAACTGVRRGEMLSLRWYGCGLEESAALSAGDEKRRSANPAALRRRSPGARQLAAMWGWRSGICGSGRGQSIGLYEAGFRAARNPRR